MGEQKGLSSVSPALNKTVAKAAARRGLEIGAETGVKNESIFGFLCKVAPPGEQPPSKILT